ncbi:hypothetical protein [Chryseobacterium carnipullorum]|uniref:hypothetical protein n=1 Tax=Chryseobacterium carnipullorum TaxID=1124835 RepID=UPI000F4E6495|nr:hypothetical protein [Chryseobacterium carnipullorum]
MDIVMPKTYIDNAENELLVKGLEQFDLHKNAKVSYDLEVDPSYMEKIGLGRFDIGDYIQVYDPALRIDKVLRVNQITTDFIQSGDYNPFRTKIVIADSYEINYSSQLILDIKEIKNVMSITNLGQINYSKLGLRTTQELQNLVFDTDGFFDPENIRPNSIETNMLTVGAKSQQISCSVVFFVMFENNKNKVKVNAGLIYSQTFEKTWNIPEDVVTIADDQYRYVYAACSKTNNTASMVFTQDKKLFDEDANDYYFLIGILHSVVDNVRVLSITVGTTTINGGLIRTGIISSLDGQMTINLDTQEIKAKIKFLNGSDGFTSINGGVVTSERIEVGDGTERNAFISGITDNGEESIRFAAGADYEHKDDAPFKVLDNGKLIAENADIKGVINATSGTFSGTINAYAGTFGSVITNKYFSITANGLETPKGWIVAGDYTGSGDRKFIQISGADLGAPLMIYDEKADGNFHTCLSLSAKNGTGGNLALDIQNGGIRVAGQLGRNGAIKVKDVDGNDLFLSVINGIITNTI